MTFDTAQDAEDAFYDALDEHDIDRMLSVWEDSGDIACLLPMQPLTRGRDNVIQAWTPLFDGQVKLDVEVRHLHWITSDDLAIHCVEERVNLSGESHKQPPVYATNIYRRGEDGWHMVLHQNSPSPPPPEMMQGR